MGKMQVCERGEQFFKCKVAWSRTGCVLDRQDHLPAIALIGMSSEVCIFIPKIVRFVARFRVSQAVCMTVLFDSVLRACRPNLTPVLSFII